MLLQSGNNEYYGTPTRHDGHYLSSTSSKVGLAVVALTAVVATCWTQQSSDSGLFATPGLAGPTTVTETLGSYPTLHRGPTPWAPHPSPSGTRHPVIARMSLPEHGDASEVASSSSQEIQSPAASNESQDRGIAWLFLAMGTLALSGWSFVRFRRQQHPSFALAGVSTGNTWNKSTRNNMALQATSTGDIEAPAPSSTAGYSVTCLESNSFSLELGSTNLLIDPWLVGSLTFADATWLFEGKKRGLAQLPFTPEEVAARFDAVVLTQGLDDHAHIPTLKRIPKGMRVIANPQAAALCQSLGFTNIEILKPGTSAMVKDVEIQAFKGSLVGPPWSEPQNGYCFKAGDFRVVTEPHGNIPDLGYTCDVLIMPCVAQRIGAYPLVNGVPEAVAAAQKLKPRLFVPLANAEIDQSGFLSEILSEVGTKEALCSALATQGLATRVATMEPYLPLPLMDTEAIAMASVTSERTNISDELLKGMEKFKNDVIDLVSPMTILQPSAKKQIQLLKAELAELVAPMNYGAKMTPSECDDVQAVIAQLEALNPNPAPVESPLLNARWDLMWTTEKEQLFFVEKGLFGSQFIAAKQDIDVGSGRLQNMIVFENGDYFKVGSSLSPDPPVRCNFKFVDCLCKKGTFNVPLPPVGKGWFDTIFLDETMRIARDVRGDTLVVTRERGAIPFSVPGEES